MKLFRLRFILLGLLLCIFHVWCRTCGSDFDDPESKAYLADVIIEGKLSQKLQTPGSGDRYNFTVRVRKVFKGQNLLKGNKKPRQVTVGIFGPVLDEENCVSNLTRSDSKYYFFLKTTEQWNYLILSSFPEKVARKIGRKIRKVSTCKKCVKAPKIKKIRGRKSVKEGGGLQLKCQIAPVKPPAVIHWEKDGVILRKRRGLHIKNGRRGSRLKIRRSKASDSGTYVCVVKNAVSTDRLSVNISVLPAGIRSTTESGVTVTPRFKPCPPEDRGYCLNNGECRIIVQLDYKTCNCQKTHRGTRCEERIPVLPPVELSPGQPALERDRTLTIIGIVIGLLIFICICIASYFLAKRRRDRFYRRQELKRRQSEVASSIPNPPPSYHKLPSIDTELGNSFTKQRPFERSYKNSETQTDDSNFVAPNPHTNINLYHNPMDSSLLRNPPSNRNSRTRLSGISMGKKDSERPTSAASVGGHTPSHTPSHRSSLPDSKQVTPPRRSSGNAVNGTSAPLRRSSDQEKKSNRNSIPKIRCVSDRDVNSDDDNAGSLTPLHISEDDIRERSGKKAQETLSPVQDDDSSSSYSDGSVSSSVENLRHLNSVKDGDMSWNERGSPEPIYKDSRNKGSYNNQFRFLNNDNGYSAKHYDKDRKKRHISDHDSKSIPV